MKLTRRRMTSGRHAGPLVLGVAALGLASTADARHAGVTFWLAAACVVLGGLGGIAAPLDRAAGIVKALAPTITLVGYALLAGATGGAQSDYLPMMVLPMVWFGIEGTDRQIAWGVGWFAFCALLPWVAFPAHGYPLRQWDEAALGLVAGIGLAAILRNLAGERAAVERALLEAAHHDPLTGLLNRTAWSQAAAAELARARRSGRPVAVASFDLDGFKDLNDSGGHEAGDRWLVAVARALPYALRAGDVIARTGGDEFLVLLPDCNAEAAAVVAERARSAVPPGIGCSAGLAIWDGEESIEALVNRADGGLYAAKASGRGRLTIASAATIAAGLHRASGGTAVARAHEMRVEAPRGGRFNELLDDAGVLLATASADRFVSVNSAFQHVLGWRAEELLACSIRDLVHPRDLAETMDAAARIGSRGERITGFRCRMLHRDGSYRVIAWYAHTDGHLWRVVGLDVSTDDGDREAGSTSVSHAGVSGSAA